MRQNLRETRVRNRPYFQRYQQLQASLNSSLTLRKPIAALRPLTLAPEARLTGRETAEWQRIVAHRQPPLLSVYGLA